MSEVASVLKIAENQPRFYTRVGDCPNVELSTKGGNMFWKTVKENRGWKLQYNTVTGLARILDENLVRKAWGSPAVMEEKMKRLLREDFLEPGDVVGVVRKKVWLLYEHYGIYIGDGTVIHYAGDGGDFGGRIAVKKDSLKKFLKGDADYFVLFWKKGYPSPRKIQVRTSFNLQDITVSTARPFGGRKGRIYSQKETVERALSRLGEENYNLFSNNCEHFAIWCKTGVSRSYQVNKAVDLLGASRRETSFW